MNNSIKRLLLLLFFIFSLISCSSQFTGQIASVVSDNENESGDISTDPDGEAPANPEPDQNLLKNLCQDLDTSLDQKTLQSLPKPGVGETIIDPAFNTKITRITDSGPSEIIKPVYNSVQSFNSDETRFFLYKTGSNNLENGHWLYNGEDYTRIKKLDIDPSDLEEIYWDYNDPKVLYFVGKGSTTRHHVLYSFDVETDQKTVVHDFSNICGADEDITFGGDLQMNSWDSNVFGMRCGTRLWISYQKSTDTVLTKAASGSATIYAPLPGPSGDTFYLGGDILDSNLDVIRSLNVANYAEHASLGQLHNGEDAYFAVAFNTTANNCGSTPGIGSVVAHSMENGSCRVLVGDATGHPFPPSGTHISALSNRNPGWVAVSSVGRADQINFDSQVGVLISEIYLTNSDEQNPIVCRVAHHRSFGNRGNVGYFAEPHVTMSPTGTRLLFGSDWGNSGSVDTYVIELPVH